MLSLSDNEFSVINFLVRNFAERLTIRSIAQKLGFSAAGVFNILKKLEKENIVVGEKLGTGLFYSLNFEEKIALHLASVVLLHSDDLPDKIDIGQIRHAKCAITNKKNLLLITDNIRIVDIQAQNANAIVKTEEEITNLLRKKDADTLELLKKGTVLFGEDIMLGIIKNCMQKF